ncbi:MAG: hypothetical protein A2600_05150 [Candidatus Lambdaproteobacteria bacterium RIFOXYD1_FULL_56_27]|uniref:Ferric oxidoreductase domain-containing protein n=1 Tax=Candidatus Lambdaproteobacteria bacterium RIFOXYD2_FULL_56_26 TaxID=1817773 RepID=A0A1F6GRN8_9PROT|nr:MAG: hypothetical protein A2426_08005 [Candidatus Lambdaproteobacteria bacterium RIFOXYC1_FULL_56_13]OGH00795.1 MAG: hypothetical protein A2557_03735 [Candidatus Lambdaproteobacteria bacterium RIFOXYD2_FULL_56_26]OGH09940.1 MAG: hypothetical protein A2600_05150 [Candidatus Lambdaproteobacteria bacterium RIFOXYD1_FULL_56_27]
MNLGLLVLLLLAPLVRTVWIATQVGLGANPLERLIHLFGSAALFVLVFLLCLPIVTRLAKGNKFLQDWTRRRRLIGLSALAYGTVHLGLYGLDQWWSPKFWANLGRPFVWTGFVSWVIFLALGLTSNQISRVRLKKNWQRLHRLVWLCVPLLVVHLTLKEEGALALALWWFGPLAALWLTERTLKLRRTRREAESLGH